MDYTDNTKEKNSRRKTPENLCMPQSMVKHRDKFFLYNKYGDEFSEEEKNRHSVDGIGDVL